MAITLYYVRPVNGADVAGQGTTHATAYKTLQFALNDIGGTHGTGADGDQVNLCDEGPNVNGASLSLAGYGAPALGAPLVIRGYTTTANDGGIGEIDGGGNALWASTAYDYINHIDLEIHTLGNNPGIYLDAFCSVINCYIHIGASAPVINQQNIRLGGNAKVFHCNLPQYGVGGTFGVYVVGTPSVVAYNNISASSSGIRITGSDTKLYSNIIYANAIGGLGIVLTNCDDATVAHNSIYSAAGNTGAGILIVVFDTISVFYNNIISNFSGIGGCAVNLGGFMVNTLGYNAIYNCTSNYINEAGVIYDLRSNDVALAADPFVNAAAGNFMLTAAAQVLLRSAGWPSTYLGAAATDQQLTIGAVQYGEGGGGSVSISPWKGNIG